MKLIVTHSIEKLANEIGLTFDDIYEFIKTNRDHGFIKLNSPIENTVAYKGYMDGVKRIIVFAVTTNGLIYPVHIGDKNDQIARNITGEIVRKNTSRWQEAIERDIINRKFKIIRHF